MIFYWKYLSLQKILAGNTLPITVANCDGFTPGLFKGIPAHEADILNLSKGIVCPKDAIVSHDDSISQHEDDTPSHKAAAPSGEDTNPQPKDANVPY